MTKEENRLTQDSSIYKTTVTQFSQHYSEFSTKKAKFKTTTNIAIISSRLSNLPDDLLLLILQYSQQEEIENTRIFQSKWVRKCTMFVDMKKAFREQNLDNMQWIKERNSNGNLANYSWKNLIDFGTFLLLYKYSLH